MANDGEIFIIDERRRDFYLIDNALVLQYGSAIGPYAIAVYNCLACHADKKREAFPSYRTIGKETGMSRDTAMKAVQTLVDWNIVRVTIEEKPNGEYANNRYHLLDVKAWKTAPSITAAGSGPQRPPKRLKQPRVVEGSNNGDGPHLPKQEPVQQNSENKTQQPDVEAAPVVDGDKPKMEEIVTELVWCGIKAKKMRDEMSLTPDLTRAWIHYTKEQEGIRNKPGFIIDGVRSGDYPPGHTSPAEAAQAEMDKETQAAQRRDVEAARRQGLREAAQSVYAGFPEGYRQSIMNDKRYKDPLDYVIDKHGREVNDVRRATS
jgi:hypothetical protein